MTDPRGYSTGTRAALAHLSRGTCYRPGCDQPIIRFIDGDPIVDFQIAHIRDAKPGNRYVADMTDDERRAFANLVLLCKPCHTLVDKTHPDRFSIELLDQWKAGREGARGGALASVGAVDDERLRDLVTAGVRAALGNPTVVVGEGGGSVRITSDGVLRLLPLEPASVPVGAKASPTRLVRARSGVVPFTVHQDIRQRLGAWCLDGAPFSARVVGGPGGAGKTRLAVQVAADMAEAGWVTGLLKPTLEQAELEALVSAPTPRLVVVDYAETRLDQVATLLPLLAAHATGTEPVRVLLLMRAAPRTIDWATALRGHSEILDAMADEVEIDLLDDLPFDDESRRDLFAAAGRAFIGRSESPGASVPDPPAGLHRPVYSTPLMVVIAAYLAVHGDRALPESRGGLLDDLFVHEDRYWARAGAGTHTDRVLRRRVVALASLAGAADEEEAAELLRLVPDLEDASDERRRLLARWANSLYPGPNWWNPLEPDVLAEHLIATCFVGMPSVLAGVLDRGDAASVVRPLDTYARAAADYAELAGALGSVLSKHLVRLCAAAAAQVAGESDIAVLLGGAMVANALDRAVECVLIDPGVLPSALNALPPRPDLVLSTLALTLTAKLVAARRRLAAANPRTYQPDLVFLLNNLAILLGVLGRPGEGLTAIEESVELCHLLVAGNSEAHEPALAASLNTLSNRLGALGRQWDGLAASEEAVAVYRRLAASRPVAYEPSLARSLNALSNRLGALGRRVEGLAAIEEAAVVCRRLADVDPTAYEPDLAMSLNNLGNRLVALGRRDASLPVFEEAVALCRRLAVANPAAHEPDLASSLSNLAGLLLDTRRQVEGLATIEEAVDVYRRLAAANPAAYEPTLALSLNNLSITFGMLGRRGEGLTTVEEAVTIRRRLAAANPAAYEAALASSLNNLSIHLAGAGRREEGLAVLEEAVAVYRRLATANPAADKPDLAGSLSNLSDRLGEAGRQDEADAVRAEAVGLGGRGSIA